jgi:hypothetical protein
MPNDTAAELTARYSQLKTNRGTWDSQWQQIADYGLGRRDFITHHIEGGRARQTRIFDATFQQSADGLAAALQALLVNAAARWMVLRPEDRSLLEDDEILQWFERATETTFTLFNKPEANFASQIHETLLDVVAFGTGVFWVDRDPKTGIWFSARPLGEIYVAENFKGRVDTVFRRFFLTAKQAHEEWGEKAGENVTKAIADNKFNERFEFCHAVLPRRDTVNFELSPRRHPIAEFYLNVKEKSIIKEGGFPEMPYMVARWSKDAGELYGRGPGMNALPDAKMLNRMARTLLVAAEKATDPTLLVEDDGVMSPTATHPGSVMVTRSSVTGREPVRYLQSTARPDISQERYQSTRQQVRDHFHSELLQGTFDDPRMTATQVLELSARTAQRIGPMIFRMQTELLEPLVERVFGLAMRAGLYDPIPEGLAGTRTRVEYVSPAALAQLNSDVQNIMGVVDTAMNWSQVNPDVLDKIDFDLALERVAQALGEASNVLRPKRDVAQIREAKAEAAEEAQEQQQLEALAKGAGQAAPALQAIQGGAAA